MSNTPFNLILISAWHEMGGNTFLRFLDGHPSLYVYPFESQISTPLSSNLLAGPGAFVAQRYSYPEFSTEWTPEQAYYSIWDEELKGYIRNPDRSKFRGCGLQMDEKERVARFCGYARSYREWTAAGSQGMPPPITWPTRANYIEAFFRSTFDTWTNRAGSGQETHYVGYSPPILFDADKFFSDFPNGHMIHVIRNPWSGYADTKKRPFPMSLTKYCQIWNVCQTQAAVYEGKYRGRFLFVKYEDLVAAPLRTTLSLAKKLGIPWNKSMMQPSFNGVPMESVYPWGTIKTASVAANRDTALELNEAERTVVQTETWPGLTMWYEGTEFDQIIGKA